MTTSARHSGAWGELTVLLENNAAAENLASEHGLSLWIETPAGKVLFDTGASDAFVHNAAVLGVDLATADAIVLSHGHYDHVGGLGHALRLTNAPVYTGRKAAVPKRAKGEHGVRDIGMETSVADQLKERGVAVEERREILSGVEVLPAAPLSAKAPSDNGRLLRESNDGLEPDPFEDEVSVLIHAPDGDVLVTGCSHRGIVNIYRQAGDVRVIVGGTHLLHESAGDIRAVAKELSGVAELWVGHCTGDAAVEVLRDEYPGKLVSIPGGTRLAL